MRQEDTAGFRKERKERKSYEWITVIEK